MLGYIIAFAVGVFSGWLQCAFCSMQGVTGNENLRNTYEGEDRWNWSLSSPYES